MSDKPMSRAAKHIKGRQEKPKSASAVEPTADEIAIVDEISRFAEHDDVKGATARFKRYLADWQLELNEHQLPIPEARQKKKRLVNLLKQRKKRVPVEMFREHREPKEAMLIYDTVITLLDEFQTVPSPRKNGCL